MNFLLRSSQIAAADQHSEQFTSNKPPTTLEGLIAEDPFPESSAADDCDMETDRFKIENDGVGAGLSGKNDSHIIPNFLDVTEEEGWITIPCNELHDDWADAPDIHSFRALDRSFVFPGEQIHILLCLSASKEDLEIITPFKVAAVMSKNGMGQSGEVSSNGHHTDQNGDNLQKENADLQRKISRSESFLRMEEYKIKTEKLLQKFKNSHFFVRISESDEPLWHKKNSSGFSQESSETDENYNVNDSKTKKSSKNVGLHTVIDKGKFDANGSGGVARSTVKCCSLSNGDIVVLLQVNIGVEFLRDPVLEILQFQKHDDKNVTSQGQDNLFSTIQDPCRDLLNWLLPIDNNTLPPLPRPISPPPYGSISGGGSTSLKSNFSSPSSSQLFSFGGHFRSYSMSSLPQNTAPSPPPVTNPSSKSKFDIEDWDRFSSEKILKSQRTKNDFSFRGVSLEPDRFSVCCGLEGIYTPGRRWRRKLDIIQPVEISSFAADCNTDDLLCVQIKNVSPAHLADIVIFVDALAIVFEGASKVGSPSFLPLACVESGNDHSLPNLALRRGEEHSFILKPATSIWKKFKSNGEINFPQQLRNGGPVSSLHLSSKIVEGKRVSISDQYAVVVSCRCNYTESKLFFKQPTTWRPRISRDIMISVASEMSKQSPGSEERVSQLPVQVLTLQASNLTSEDLTLTVLAPASFNSPPTVVSLNSTPSTPVSPFVGFSEFTGKMNGEQSTFNDQTVPESDDVIPSNGLGCSHLWLQSRIPLGCVPSQSTATIKLELLPLTDGIVTLDTLQIDVKEKGVIYIPENPLMINATSSIFTGIV